MVRRRALVRRPARDQKARPDAANGGDRSAMTIRVVGEAVEPRARAHISAQHDQDWDKRDKLRVCSMMPLQDPSSA